MSNLVTLSASDTHTLVTIDDGKANALSFDMFDALNTALDEAEKAGKVVLIAGRPGKFSAGFDLSILGQGGDTAMKLLRAGADMAARLMAFPTPVVLAVSGHALAMGAMLCMSADYRVGMRGAYKIGLNEAAIGMVLPWFGVELARARLSKPHFSQAVGNARIYDPDTAVDAGFLDEVVEDSELLARATEIAVQLSALDMPSHRGCKGRVREEFFELYAEALRKDFGDS